MYNRTKDKPYNQQTISNIPTVEISSHQHLLPLPAGYSTNINHEKLGKSSCWFLSHNIKHKKRTLQLNLDPTIEILNETLTLFRPFAYSSLRHSTTAPCRLSSLPALFSSLLQNLWISCLQVKYRPGFSLISTTTTNFRSGHWATAFQPNPCA